MALVGSYASMFNSQLMELLGRIRCGVAMGVGFEVPKAKARTSVSLSTCYLQIRMQSSQVPLQHHALPACHHTPHRDGYRYILRNCEQDPN